MSIFKQAKEKGKSKAKSDKVEVVIADPMFHVSLNRMIEINRQIDELKGEGDILSGEVKSRGIEEFNKLYEKTKRYPGSFMIKANCGAKMKPSSFMMIPTDKYIKIDEDRFNELVDRYGDDIVEEKVSYGMNPELVEKYGEILDKLITECKDITKEDKEALITASTAWSIKKGVIAEIPTLFPGETVENVVTEIRPIFQVKNPKIEDQTPD